MKTEPAAASAPASSSASFSVLAFAACLIALCWAYLIVSETPRGQVNGVALLSNAQHTPLADCDVYLTPAPNAAQTEGDDGGETVPAATSHNGAEADVRERRHAKTDKRGQFLLRNVPAGRYQLSASAKWHSAPEVVVEVREGKLSTVPLTLKRSEADLSVGDHQSVFATSEIPFLPVRGYATLPVPKSAKNGAATAPAAISTDVLRAAKKLHVKVWRTRLGDVLTRADAASDLEKLRHSYDGKEAVITPALLRPNPDVAPAPKLITDAELPITASDREGFFAEHFSLDAAKAKPGLYLVKVSFGSFSACSYVVVTDMALVVKRASRANQTVVYAADVMKGTPIANARVRVLKQGKTIARGTTEADGVAAIDTPPVAAKADDEENDAPLLTMATVGDDEAVVSGTSYYGGGEDKKYAVHVVTDRTVYRPGDTISYKAIARTRRDTDGQQQAYSVPDGVTAQMELRDESGNLVARQNKTTNRHGAVWGSMNTSKEGATGTYTLTTSLGGETHDSEIVVAAYRKPEFSVTVTPQKKRVIRGEPVQMTVKATYYFGGPVAGGKVHYYWFRDADWSAEYGDAFEGEDENGDDASSYRSKPYQSYFGEGMGDGEIQLDENGEAVITARTDIRHLPDPEADKLREASGEDKNDETTPQVETYKLTAQVEDEAKRSVEADGEAAVANSDLTVSVAPEGYVATPDKAMPVFVTVRDGQTKKLKAGVPVTLLAVYDTWNKIKKETVAVPLTRPQTQMSGKDGRAVFQVVPPRAGDVRLVATVQDDQKRTAKAESDLWAASNNGDNLDTDYGDLTLLTDKRNYEPGDTAKILVNSSRVGQSVLLSVEGERVYQTVVLPISTKSTVYQLPILADWGPNVTLSANYVKDKKFASSETPLRVRVQAQNLTVSVKAIDIPASKKYQPGDTATFAVSVKDAKGRPVASDFAIGVVDESIYALREDNPRATAQTFYPRRSNRVSTQYSFNVEYLGDVSKAEPKIKARTKFRDTAYWRASNQTGDDGQAIVSVTLPDNLTTWRATVQAVSDRTGVGYAKTKIVSTKPFFVRLNPPRYLVGGDASVLSALVHNETGQEQQIRVRLTASALTVAGDETQTLTVKSGEVGTVTWQVSPQGNGIADRAGLRVTAWTGANAPNGKPYTDGIEQTLPLRAFGRTTYTPFAGTVESGGANDEAQTLTIQPGAITDETRLTLRVTPSVRGAIAGGVEYLVGFPYGCTEQTLSRFVPDLLAQKYDLLTGEAASKNDLSRMARDSVTRLTRMQHSSGAWGWWETDGDDPFMTAYALTGLAQAKASGYAVSDTMLQSAMKAAAEMAQTKPVRQRPFLLYALHQAGYKDTNNLLRAPFRYSSARTHLFPEKLPVDALAYLVLLGHELNENVSPFYVELEKRGIAEGSLLHFTVYPQKSGSGYDGICSDRMASALALRALLVVRKDDTRLPSILRYLMLSRTGGYFGDTRDTSWVLTAFCDYLNVHPREAATPSGTINVLLNNKTVETIDAQNDNRMENGEVVVKIPAQLLDEGANTLSLSRENGAAKSGAIFYSGELAQTVASKNGDLPALAEGVHVTREILRVVPKQVNGFWQLSTEPTSGTIKRGDRLRVRLTLTADRSAFYVLIEDTFPSGAEVTERGTADEEAGDGSGGPSFWYDHVDVRDSNIAFFAGKLPKGKHVLEYNLRAQTPGKSAALPASVRAMYDPSFKGESGATIMEIKP